jgi:ATP-dependent Clp protease ATP-binding subunit ClpC
VPDEAPVALRKTLAGAEQESRRLRHGYIGFEHLLLGLLRLEGTHAAEHLRQASVDCAQVRERIATIVGTGGDDVLTANVLPFTPNAHRVCRRVLEEAETTEPAKIGTEHVLRALLRERESLAVRVLADAGVNRTRLQSHLRRPRPDSE